MKRQIKEPQTSFTFLYTVKKRNLSSIKTEVKFSTLGFLRYTGSHLGFAHDARKVTVKYII